MAVVTVPTDAGCDQLIVTNVDGERFFAGPENGDTMPHAYNRANSQLAVSHPIAGRRYPIAFRPTIEGDSDIFTRTLVVATDNDGAPMVDRDPYDPNVSGQTGIDRFPFDPVIELIESVDVAYLCYLDGHGRRWFAFIEFVQGTYTYQAHEHSIDIKITEVDMTPLITDAQWAD